MYTIAHLQHETHVHPKSQHMQNHRIAMHSLSRIQSSSHRRLSIRVTTYMSQKQNTRVPHSACLYLLLHNVDHLRQPPRSLDHILAFVHSRQSYGRCADVPRRRVFFSPLHVKCTNEFEKGKDERSNDHSHGPSSVCKHVLSSSSPSNPSTPAVGTRGAYTCERNVADAPILLDDDDVQFHFRPKDETRSVVNYNGSLRTVAGNHQMDGETQRNAPLSLDCKGKQRSNQLEQMRAWSSCR